ncbi:transcription factor MYB [Trifolium pratense]|uniref:Transcription factor MYB n=1 Tax=Trifolium pratense TaxID=57577 RepID=A0A2K3JSE4_TRIPR|nr:transcription factor MYB [Trifolium pratense]
MPLNTNNLIETTQTFASLQTPSTFSPSNQYQTSFNVISNDQLYVSEQEQPRSLTENISNICSTSCNENSIWVSRDDDFRDSTFEEGIKAQVEKEKEKICDEKGMKDKEVNNEKEDIEMNSCFENSNFDFGLLESVLNSEFISHDLDYMDELAWNF